MRRAVLSALLAGSMIVLPFATQSEDGARNPAAIGARADWEHHGGGVDAGNYSQLDAVNKSTIGRLGLTWSLDLPGEQILEATPLAIDGVLYFTGSHSAVYAVDAASGKLSWRYDPEIWKHNPFKLRTVVGYHRGAAYADGRIFSGTLDGRLIALDAKTGKLLWSAETVKPDDYHTITSAPLAFKDKVVIGNGGGDYGERGYVTAYDQKTGQQSWRFYTVPGRPEENKGDPAMERAAATWSGEYWKTGTGGTAWNGVTFDPELNLIYIGSGNSSPNDPAVRSPGDGDNLYLVSAIAVDADTGKYVWHYQMNPREAWGWKAVGNLIAATLQIDGKPRKVLMESPSNGFFYVLDRKTGKLLSAEKTGKVTWAERIDLNTGRPVEAPNIRYENGETTIWPSVSGTHNWQDMSFSPRTGLVYIPYMQLGGKFHKAEKKAAPGQKEIGWVIADEHDGKGALLAWDPVQQKERWRVWHGTFWNGAAMSTAGDLVFQGTADGYLSAYDAFTGKRVWHFNAGLGILAAPVSYAVNGKQYVSVLVGHGGTTYLRDLMAYGWKYGAQPRRLLTFALDGAATLPKTAPPDFTWKPIDDPELKISKADAAAGDAIFAKNCAMCHGRDGQSRGAPGPDLRESQIALYSDSIWTVVHEGALMQRGMPRFDSLTREQVNQIHAYIRTLAREALATPKPAATAKQATSVSR